MFAVGGGCTGFAAGAWALAGYAQVAVAGSAAGRLGAGASSVGMDVGVSAGWFGVLVSVLLADAGVLPLPRLANQYTKPTATITPTTVTITPMIRRRFARSARRTSCRSSFRLAA
jgi:hypothetical protein